MNYSANDLQTETCRLFTNFTEDELQEQHKVATPGLQSDSIADAINRHILTGY